VAVQSSVIGISKARKVSRRRVRTRIVLWSFGGFVTKLFIKLFIEFSIELFIEPSIKPFIKCFIVRSLKPLFRSELVFRKRLFFGIQYLAYGI
jgi:hypothetical protein